MEFELAPYIFSSPSKDECSKFLAKGTPILSRGRSTLLLKFTNKEKNPIYFNQAQNKTGTSYPT